MREAWARHDLTSVACRQLSSLDTSRLLAQPLRALRILRGLADLAVRRTIPADGAGIWTSMPREP